MFSYAEKVISYYFSFSSYFTGNNQSWPKHQGPKQPRSYILKSHPDQSKSCFNQQHWLYGGVSYNCDAEKGYGDWSLVRDMKSL